MVVCKCRKATKLYCFVHKVPVCGECICFPEHQICVVRSYSEWVIDGEYDWPPTCSKCQSAIEDDSNAQTVRLGCLHIIHTKCLVSHIQSFPPHTAPAGYVCPSCSTPVWPPKSIKDSGSRLHSKLKEAIIQSGMEKNLLGNYLVSLPATEYRSPPPAFASDPLAAVNEKGNSNAFESTRDTSSLSSSAMKMENLAETQSPGTGVVDGTVAVSDIVEIGGPSSVGNPFTSVHESNFQNMSPGGPGATTRKGSHSIDKYSEVSYYADDEDGSHRKYTRRGPFRHKFLRFLLPFWSSALPTLPVTAPPRKEGRDGTTNDEVTEGRSRPPRSSRMDPRKLLLIMAIMACMITMIILYYRIAQRGFFEEGSEDGQE
ncbi:zinc finger protein-like 1 homolog [Amborella trichopoda]|uniref:RING-type domain-containing protein n=1 Tax=Amborella trichopoda TaxID=13333 RepID=W1PUE6_AMBTC|nr:zinc finger protein-like 1 homolog [Amborella trichopoda]ERN10925.1 hypothetical protein AMTR_s00164p00063950 [Amborella trichopoda]|eukprot:XP_006849344.1 zinc finger protein-like 1 homolog [Amborella trichopoda]